MRTRTVAAYQTPLFPVGSMAALELIRQRVVSCEQAGVEFLCCPEAIFGGLADYSARPLDFAIDVSTGELDTMLAPLASDTVTTIIGFTELASDGALFNSAAVFHRGAVAGVYRKIHPAIRRSVYRAGELASVFTIGDLTFGVIICYDSTFPELARSMAEKGAMVLFVPTNTALPPERADVSADARRCDIALATDNSMYVVRADVAGRIPGFVSYGSSGIVAPDGTVLASAQRLAEDLLIADVR